MDSDQVLVNDPLRHCVDLPLRATFYPLGFPAGIETNSPLVLRAARESWGEWAEAFPRPPLRVRVAVAEGPAAVDPPAFRAQRQLLAIVAGADNFALCDLGAGFAFCWVTAATLEDAGYFRFHFLEAMVYCTLAQLHVTPVHAACAALEDRGVLLCGASGAGKTCLAYALARRGWQYVSDDGTNLLRDGGARIVVGKPHHIRFRPSAAELFPELAGRLATTPAGRKPTIEIRTCEIPGIARSTTCRAEYILFLNRASGTTGLAPLSREEALARLVAELPLFEESAYQQQIRTLHGLLEAPAFELRYATLEAGARAIEDLVERPGK
ncbi:MAG: aldolase [Candidatus Solibacter usitatus]|nr:aldolase [Candidatus Solibacter usitatus]